MARLLFSLLFVMPAISVPAAGADIDPTQLARELAATRLDPAGAVRVENLELAMGLATLRLESGVVFPTTPAGGVIGELVFVGKGVLRGEAPDAIEAGQLELFTGQPRLEVELEEMVLALGRSDATAAVLRRGTAAPESPQVQRAEALYREWKSARRRLLGVETGLWASILGDPVHRGYFGAWVRSEAMGELLYLVDPVGAEQVTIGQFVPIELSARERRRASRALGRQQRQGRLMGLDLEGLGQFDTWLSSPLMVEGVARPGFEPFEPQDYELEAEIASASEGVLRGRARIRSRALTSVASVASLRLHTDLQVSALRDGAGEALAFLREGPVIRVFLGRPPAAGEEVVIDVEYRGAFLDREGKSWALRDAMAWYPRAGKLDRARYDVTVRWPKNLELVGSGSRVAGGEEDGRRWERRTLESPALGFGFEIGDFEIVSSTVRGRIPLHVAFDRESRRDFPKGLREEIIESAAASLELFDQHFGAYPYPELTVVTAPRNYSQAMPGLVTLSQVMMADLGVLGVLLGVEDRRTVVAHEVAHQWWGHAVGWSSYRDQWISEAFANYAALYYARTKLGKVLVGPVAGWRQSLLSELEDGRPLESVGPVVLGGRLDSSKSGGAYDAIVYKKGAIVVEMLAQMMTEDGFVAVLGAIAQAAAGRTISTAELIELLEQASGLELDGFAQQFVYGTGLPEVYYEVRFEPGTSPGRWRVVGEARQEAPYRYRYRAEQVGQGWDVRRARVEQVAVSDWSLPTAVQIAVFQPSGKHQSAKAAAAREPNAMVKGRVLLQGATTPLALEIADEPRDFWLDRDQQSFATFYDARRHPRRIQFYRGIDLAAAGSAGEAEAAFRAALAAPVVGPDEKEPAAAAVRLLDGRIHLHLARVLLDQGRDREAEAALAEARKLQRGPGVSRRELWQLEARLELQRGRYDEVLRSLERLTRRGELDTAEAHLLVAVAARELGRREVFERALAAAERRGAEVGVLRAGVP